LHLYDNCCRGTATSIMHSTSIFVVFSIQHAFVHCACAILLSVACPTLQHFSTLSHKQHHWKKVIEHEMCVLIISKTFAWNSSHSKKKCVRYDKKMYAGLHVKYLFIRFLMKLEFPWHQIHSNSASGSQVVPSGWTARKTWGG